MLITVWTRILDWAVIMLIRGDFTTGVSGDWLFVETASSGQLQSCFPLGASAFICFIFHPGALPERGLKTWTLALCYLQPLCARGRSWNFSTVDKWSTIPAIISLPLYPVVLSGLCRGQSAVPVGRRRRTRPGQVHYWAQTLLSRTLDLINLNVHIFLTGDHETSEMPSAFFQQARFIQQNVPYDWSF